MMIRGYKLNGYNATYETCNIDVRRGYNGSGKCVLEVEDVLSGITYFFEADEILESWPRKNKKRRSK